MTQPTEEQIRTRAYFLWEADGCPQGRDWEYWMMAQGDLTADPVKTVAEPSASKPSTLSSKKEKPSPKRRTSQSSAVYA